MSRRSKLQGRLVFWETLGHSVPSYHSKLDEADCAAGARKHWPCLGLANSTEHQLAVLAMSEVSPRDWACNKKRDPQGIGMLLSASFDLTDTRVEVTCALRGDSPSDSSYSPH